MRFIVRTKNGYGKDIKARVVNILQKNGADYTDKIEPGCDFAVIIGGDGTLLRDHSDIKCPVLGINPGKSVGFYMTATHLDYEEKILAMLNGKLGKDYYVYKLLRLATSLNGKKIPCLILNDVVISSVFVRRIFESNLHLNGEKSLERNSGIIVYTPTGSHAFAHSAGAMPLRYDSDRFGVIGLAPYSGELKKGEILLKNVVVKIECLSEKGELVIDGSELHIRELLKGDVVSVQKSDKPLLLVGFKKNFE